MEGKAFLLPVVFGLLAFSVQAEKSRLLPSYKCKSVGNFSHPDTCTAFVECDANLTAFEEDCPVCTTDVSCITGRPLHFDEELGECVWKEDYICPPRDECTQLCKQVGDCDCFDTCLPDNSSSSGGRWHKGRYCDAGLYWNPDYTGNSHGGSCDLWDNLSSKVQEKYRMDHSCATPPLDCFWEAHPVCANMYLYLEAGSKNIQNLKHYKCPDTLFWNQERLACGLKCTNHPTCRICDEHELEAMNSTTVSI